MSPSHVIDTPVSGLRIRVRLTDGEYSSLMTWLTHSEQQHDSAGPEQHGEIVLAQGDVRAIEYQAAPARLTISGPDLDNLEEVPRLGVLLSVWRFIALCADHAGYAQLHASAVEMPSGQTVIFGDDDGFIGPQERSIKTLPTIVAMLTGGRFVGDELLLFDRATQTIRDTPNLPVRVREEWRRIALDLGARLTPSRLLYRPHEIGRVTNGSARPDIVVYLHVAGRSSFRRLSDAESFQRALITATAHQAKFLRPELDRAQFETGRDFTEAKNIREWTSLVLNRFPGASETAASVGSLPSWHVEVDCDEQIVEAIRLLDRIRE